MKCGGVNGIIRLGLAARAARWKRKWCAGLKFRCPRGERRLRQLLRVQMPRRRQINGRRIMRRQTSICGALRVSNQREHTVSSKFDAPPDESVCVTTFYTDFGDLRRRPVRFEPRIRSALASKKAPMSLRR